MTLCSYAEFGWIHPLEAGVLEVEGYLSSWALIVAHGIHACPVPLARPSVVPPLLSQISHSEDKAAVTERLSCLVYSSCPGLLSLPQNGLL